jgi:hypothetical protein
MTYEPADMVPKVRIVAAVELFLRLRSQFPAAPKSELAGRAVDTTFCTGLAFGAHAVACRLASRRAPLTAEVLRRASIKSVPDVPRPGVIPLVVGAAAAGDDG